MSTNKQPKKKREFRYHPIIYTCRNGKTIMIDHPAFIFLEQDGNYYYVTITHSNKINEQIVFRLKKNPNPNDKKDAFCVMEIRNDKKQKFGSKRKSWTIDPEDEEKIIQLFYKK